MCSGNQPQLKPVNKIHLYRPKLVDKHHCKNVFGNKDGVLACTSPGSAETKYWQHVAGKTANEAVLRLEVKTADVSVASETQSVARS